MSSWFQVFVLVILVAMAANSPVIKGLNIRKLQENTTMVPGTPDGDLKCGGCPCNNPCYPSPPPPSPPPPPPSPPPPPKKPPTPSQNCPPPPSSPSTYIYITGPPGDLYPVRNPYGSGTRRSSVAALPLLAAWGLLGMLAFW